MENTSGIKPVGHRVLLLPDAVEKTTASGIVIADVTTGKEQQAQIKCTVVEVGPGCWADTTVGDWAKAGDKVIIGKFCGLIIKGSDSKDYRLINDLDVVALVN